MTQSSASSDRVGTPCTYVDERGDSHSGIITADHSYGTQEKPSINLVYVVGDIDKLDSYGRQIARATSVVHQDNQGAHGRYWK